MKIGSSSNKFYSFILPLMIIFCITLCNWSSLRAEWEPEQCFVDYDINCINDQKFKELKDKVLKQLKNSWCSEEKTNLLMDLVLITKPTVCVEIGAFTGSSILPVAATLQYLKKGKVFAIDAWSNAEAVKYLPYNDPNRQWWASVDMSQVCTLFNTMMKDWSLQPYCTAISKPSIQAVSSVPTIDFLNLDGDYSEIGAMQDVERYLPKVKSGGYILLSNFYTMVNGKQPKMKAFCALFEACEITCEIERDNAILFRKR